MTEETQPPAVSKHERRLFRRLQKREEKVQEESKRGKEKFSKRALYVALGVVILIAVGYGAFSLGGAPQSNGEFDLMGIPDSFVHWHADIDIILCGQEQRLPEALPGSLIGPPSLHTHDRQENLRSMPRSDGNGVIHNEAVIPSQPGEQTLGRFLDHMNIQFSGTQIMNRKNGDLCPNGNPGTVTLLINGQPNSQWRNYIPRDGDTILIDFGAAQ